jgi:acyl carrier protein
MLEKEVIELVADVLSIDETDQLNMDSNLIDDLAAESIDFIDIMYRFETDFNLGKVAATDIFPAILQQKDSYEHGKLKEDKIALLSNYPHIKGDILEELQSTGNYKVLFKLKNIQNFIEWKKSTLNS